MRSLAAVPVISNARALQLYLAKLDAAQSSPQHHQHYLNLTPLIPSLAHDPGSSLVPSKCSPMPAISLCKAPRDGRYGAVGRALGSLTAISLEAGAVPLYC